MDVVVVPGLETTSTLPPSSTGHGLPGWRNGMPTARRSQRAAAEPSCSPRLACSTDARPRPTGSTQPSSPRGTRGSTWPRNGCSSTTATSSPAAAPQPSSISPSISSSASVVSNGPTPRRGCCSSTATATANSPTRSALATTACTRNEFVHRAQDHIADRLGTDLRAGDVATAVGVSERTLVRHFRAELGASVQAQIRHNGSKPPSVPSKPATHPSTTSEGPSATATAHHSGGPSTRRPDSLLKASGASSPGTEPGGRAADLVDGESRRPADHVNQHRSQAAKQPSPTPMSTASPTASSASDRTLLAGMLAQLGHMPS